MPKPSTADIEQFKKDHPDQLATFDVAGVEVFAAGHWNGDTYSTADLDAMVKSFNEAGAELKPYLKLGHAKGQSLVASDELPAAGWVTNLRRVGNKLVADFTGVPKRIYQLLKARAYRRVSSEIFVNLKLGEKVYPYALKAVALLGGETPAVSTLQDVMALYAACGAAKAYSAEDADVREYDYTPHREENDMEPKDKRIAELEAENKDLREGKLKEFSAKVEKLSAENKDLTSKLTVETARADKAEGEVAVFASKAEAAEINKHIDQLIADKKVAPAQREAVYAMLKAAKDGATKKFSVGGKEQGLDEIVKAFFAAAPKLDVNTETESDNGTSQEAGSAGKAARAKEYAAKNKVSFEDALIEVDKQDQAKASA